MAREAMIMAKKPKVRLPMEKALGMKARHIIWKQKVLAARSGKDYFPAITAENA
ncbi:MAG: hypothetical protein OHK0011_00660 [Turneriella sp.]